MVFAFTATGPEAGFLPFAMFFYSIPFLLVAAWYLIAAFLLARAEVGWRAAGALLDASASLAIASALVEEGLVLSGRDGPLPVAVAIASIWVGALIPVFVEAFRRTSRDG